MRGINRVTLLGNLGKDPEIKMLADGTTVAKVTLATTETYRLKTGESQIHTEWHSIILWRGLATLADKFLKKGSMVYVEGKLKTRQYEDKEGQKRYVTEVTGDQLLMLDKKPPSAASTITNEGFNIDLSPF